MGGSLSLRHVVRPYCRFAPDNAKQIKLGSDTRPATSMRTMQNAVLIGLTCAAISLAAAEDNPAVKKDMA